MLKSISSPRLKSISAPNLHKCDRQILKNYFENSWSLEEMLLKSLVSEDLFYLNPDPLRNCLIFYLGHSAVFYINKLIRVGLLDKPINRGYEILFEIGVDPETTAELETEIKDISWPQVPDVWQYRDQAKEAILAVINNTPFNLPIHQNHPLWGLMMSIEHSRIHFETSSMLIRQLRVDQVKRPEFWEYAPSQGKISSNEMIRVTGGFAKLGKPEDGDTYGWDSEYGEKIVEVNPFLASKYLITNGEFLEFVEDNGYDNRDFWDDESWAWNQEYNVQHPKFWISSNDGYQYRATFDELDLPLDWPVEVNHHEAKAYCRWKGEDIRLMTEAEWNIATTNPKEETDGNLDNHNYNLNLKYGSPSPVGILDNAASFSGLYDLRGNVWELLSDNFHPLPGFKPHPLYEDYSAPFFGTQHNIMVGGAWTSTGTYASAFCRNWFRRNFYQHAGFRIAQDIDK